MIPLRLSGPPRPSSRGFTLIEVMITVAIIGILAAVALPTYRAYVVRGRLVAGTNALASLRTSMEQYYQDNRTYQDVSTGIKSPCSFSTSGSNVADTFTLSCASVSSATYTATATGSGLTSGAVYTVNQQNAQATLGLPSVLGSVPSSNQCWIMRKGDSC